jgi:hypothetical protein
LSDPTTVDLLISLLPILFVTFILFLVAIPISYRKGKGLAFALLVLIPLAGMFVVIYLASLTDKKVLDRLAALEGKPRT